MLTKQQIEEQYQEQLEKLNLEKSILQKLENFPVKHVVHSNKSFAVLEGDFPLIAQILGRQR